MNCFNGDNFFIKIERNTAIKHTVFRTVHQQKPEKGIDLIEAPTYAARGHVVQQRLLIFSINSFP